VRTIIVLTITPPPEDMVQRVIRKVEQPISMREVDTDDGDEFTLSASYLDTSVSEEDDEIDHPDILFALNKK
jgi:hypothetical protein